MSFVRCVIFAALALGMTLSAAFAQSPSSLLQSGPMLGYAQMREVALWAQTKQSARVKFVYYETTNASVRYETDEVVTMKNDAYTAHLIATELEPGRKYTYELYINGKKVPRPYPLEFQTLKLWQWRGDPPTFKIALGSCTYVNQPPYERPDRLYGSDYEIFKALHDKRPDAMLWLGDKVIPADCTNLCMIYGYLGDQDASLKRNTFISGQLFKVLYKAISSHPLVTVTLPSEFYSKLLIRAEICNPIISLKSINSFIHKLIVIIF